MENGNLQLSQELEGDVKFLGMMEGVEGWARALWKKNPQLLDFYKTNCLSQVAADLDDYDNSEGVRENWRKNGKPVSFFNGRDFDWRNVKAGSREELKKILLDSVRSFVPNADDMSPEMEGWFWEVGNNWMINGCPTCWQDLYEYCGNPDYDGSLSWDDD